jgi:hypothetical protein
MFSLLTSTREWIGNVAGVDRREGLFMAGNKRQQTMAKIRREQAVRERRVLKQEKKEAARRAKAGEGTIPDAPGDAEGEAPPE